MTQISLLTYQKIDDMIKQPSYFIYNFKINLITFPVSLNVTKKSFYET